MDTQDLTVTASDSTPADLPTDRTTAPELDLTGTTVPLGELIEHLGPVAAMTALRDADDSIVDFRYDLVNPAFCEVLGESADALVGRRLLELYPSHVELGLFDAYCDVVDTGEPFISELPWFDERNLHAFLEVRVVRFRDGYLLSGQDITTAKVGEQVQQIFEQSRDGIVSIDRQMRITAWNAGAERLFGLAEHDAVGRPVSVTVPAELRAEQMQRLTAAMAHPDDLATFETTGHHVDGSTCRVEVCATPIRGLDGEVVGASLIHRELTHRRLAASAAEEHRAEQAPQSAPSTVAVETAPAPGTAPAPQPPLDVEVWCRSTGKWVAGFHLERFEPDGSVLVRRITDRNALPEPLPRDSVRPAPTHRRTGW
jgi:PAS domain S-box-containing protein